MLSLPITAAAMGLSLEEFSDFVDCLALLITLIHFIVMPEGFLDALASLETTHVSQSVSQSPVISPKSQCSPVNQVWSI